MRQRQDVTRRWAGVGWHQLLVIGLVLIPLSVLASGGTDQPLLSEQPVVGEKGSLSAWVIDLYHNHRFWFASLVTVVMALLGTIISQISERLLTVVGLAARRPRGQ